MQVRVTHRRPDDGAGHAARRSAQSRPCVLQRPLAGLTGTRPRDDADGASARGQAGTRPRPPRGTALGSCHSSSDSSAPSRLRPFRRPCCSQRGSRAGRSASTRRGRAGLGRGPEEGPAGRLQLVTPPGRAAGRGGQQGWRQRRTAPEANQTWGGASPAFPSGVSRVPCGGADSPRPPCVGPSEGSEPRRLPDVFGGPVSSACCVPGPVAGAWAASGEPCTRGTPWGGVQGGWSRAESRRESWGAGGGMRERTPPH